MILEGRLTIEVWHQTSGRKGTNNLRDDQLVPAGIDMEACHRKCVTMLRLIALPCLIWLFYTPNYRGAGNTITGQNTFSQMIIFAMNPL